MKGKKLRNLGGQLTEDVGSKEDCDLKWERTEGF